MKSLQVDLTHFILVKTEGENGTWSFILGYFPVARIGALCQILPEEHPLL